jgi:uncharacterized protein YeaO (DUF488 family)
VRILVDRLWPRGMTKQRANLSVWCRDIAPSTELRRWYGHDPALFGEFSIRYAAELGTPASSAILTALIDSVETGTLTLLTATQDITISAAAVLADYLSSQLPLR